MAVRGISSLQKLFVFSIKKVLCNFSAFKKQTQMFLKAKFLVTTQVFT